MFRVTLARTAKTHAYGSGCIGGLHTVEFRGLGSFLRGRTFAECCDDFGALSGVDMYKAFATAYLECTGEDIANVYVYRNVYTIGGAAKRTYLTLKYGTPALSKYHKEFPQDEDEEDYFRRRRLLLGGMCFYDGSARGRFVEGDINKYDINSLYPHTANIVGALGRPEVSDHRTFARDKTGDYEYILVLSDVVAFKRDPRLPDVFSDPFEGLSGNVIEVGSNGDEWAVFGTLWRELQKFYMFEEFEIKRVFRCKKIPDPAMMMFNDKFYQLKASAKARGDRTAYLVSKLFMNALCGKFSQYSKYRETLAYFNKEEDCVQFKEGDIVNRWKKSHFHFIRGAYIYAMARVRVMRDIYTLWNGDKNGFVDIYTDTDCIITRSVLPVEWVDNARLGAYKLEAEYTGFGVLSKKVYYASGEEEKVVVAGVRRGEVLAQARELCGPAASSRTMWTALSGGTIWQAPIVARVPYGAAKINIECVLKDINIENLL